MLRASYIALRTHWANKLAEAALLPVYLARRRRKVDAADADADEDYEEGEDEVRESCMVTHDVCTLCNIKHIKHTDILVRS